MSKQTVNNKGRGKSAIVRVDKPLHERAVALVARSPGTTLIDVVNQALEDFLDYYGDDGVIEITYSRKVN